MDKMFTYFDVLKQKQSPDASTEHTPTLLSVERHEGTFKVWQEQETSVGCSLSAWIHSMSLLTSQRQVCTSCIVKELGGSRNAGAISPSFFPQASTRYTSAHLAKYKSCRGAAMEGWKDRSFHYSNFCGNSTWRQSRPSCDAGASISWPTWKCRYSDGGRPET